MAKKAARTGCIGAPSPLAPAQFIARAAQTGMFPGMASVIPASLSRFRRSASWIDDALYAVAVYAVPFLIALGTIATLYFLPRQYESRGALPLSVVTDQTDSFRPADALAALRHAQPVPSYSTRLSEKPVWFTFTTPVMSQQSQTVVELPSHHAQTLACWDAQTLCPLGQADRDASSGKMRPVKAGFFILAGQLKQAETILCRGTYSGPAQVNAFAWDWQGLRNSALDFQESLGLIARGGVLTLAVFVFGTALINHEWTYVIFAVWLVVNLRLCANAMRWDMQWLGRMLPSEFLTPLHQFTFAAYYLLTAALFQQLFRHELRVVGERYSARHSVHRHRAVRGGVCLAVRVFHSDAMGHRRVRHFRAAVLPHASRVNDALAHGAVVCGIACGRAFFDVFGSARLGVRREAAGRRRKYGGLRCRRA